MPMKPIILKKLRERRLKLTPQRLAIIDALIENTSLHPGASLIYKEAKKKTPSLSLSTVYATLDELSQLGMVKMLEFDRMENRWEGNTAAHINLVCRGCSRIMDYSPSLAINLKEVARRARFRVTDTRLEFYGTCEACRKRR
jgi:Fur family transcriptional regulator, peroxide stress response regulator